MTRFERGLIVLIAAVAVGGLAALLVLEFGSSAPNLDNIFHSCHTSGLGTTTTVTRIENGSVSVTSAGVKLCSVSVDYWPSVAFLGGAAIGGGTAFLVLRWRRPHSPA